MSAGFIGRVLTVTLDGVPLAKVQTKRVAISHGEIDVSHEEQDGYRRLLPVRDTTSMTVDVEGVAAGGNVNRLVAAYFADQYIPVGVELPTGRFFSGDCVLTGLSFNGPVSSVTTFSATLTFSGEVAQVFDRALYGGSGGRGGIVAAGGGGGGAGDGGADVPDYYEQGDGGPEYGLYVCASGVVGGSTNQAIVHSGDGGLTWSPHTTPAGLAVVALAQSVSRGEVLALTAAGAVLRTADHATWQSLSTNMVNGAWTDLIRVEPLGLYIACGTGSSGNPSDTQRIATSPDGVSWTIRSSVVVRAWQRLHYNPVTGVVLCGSATNGTQPMLRSADGVTWAQVAAHSLSFTADEIVSVTSGPNIGRYVIGDRGSTSDIFYTDDLLSFGQVGVNNGKTALAYDPVTGLVVWSDLAGIFSASPQDLIGTLVADGGAFPVFSQVEDIVPRAAGGFIGVRGVTGSHLESSIVQSSNGAIWTSSNPAQLSDAAQYTRIYEFLEG